MHTLACLAQRFSTQIRLCRSTLSIASLSFLVGCGGEETVAESSMTDGPPARKGLTSLEYMDPQTGMVQHRAPYPGGWRYDSNPNDQLILRGPDGVEVYRSNSGQIFYSNDPFALESVQMTGSQIAPVAPLQQYLLQQIAPYMSQRGFELTDQFPMPKIKEFWELFGAAMPQGLSTKHFDVMGAEWVNQDGTRALTILVQNVFLRDNLINWHVSVNELYAPAAEYESAKEAYVYASENTEVNPQWQIAKNNELLAQLRADRQVWDERLRQSRIQHIERMNAILARGEAASSVAKTNSDILDISHQGYLKRSNMVSAGQADTINMISEQSVITNPGTGELYKVDAGSQHYWVNAEGRYISTDNSLYDPRTDQQMSDQQWERFEVLK